jgi:peptidyl-tRNA hydrolase
MADPIKQVIVINMASKMPLGRLLAQAMHASTLNILERGKWDGDKLTIDATNDFALKRWLEKQFTKVVCKAWGEDHLLRLKQAAEFAGIHVSVMEEDGETTAIALGPDFTERLAFTNNLPLL